MHYNTLNDYLKSKYGCKVYKLSLNGGMTCPNRDGTLGTGGCIFCSEAGSGEFSASAAKSVALQIEQAKQRVAAKIKGEGKYIAYFQSFTNTYAPTARLEELFTEAIKPDDVVALSVATRPDCLPDDVLELLKRLNEQKPVWVELGLQTIHERTAELIKRGYKLDCFEEAVKKLKSAGITVIVHLIIGLPGENAQKVYETVDCISRLGVDGVKFHLLHIVKGTVLEKMYLNGEYQPLGIDEYTDILEECVRRLSDKIIIHRLTGDGDKKTLVAPMWSADKKRVLNYINKRFEQDNVIQGEKFRCGGDFANKS